MGAMQKKPKNTQERPVRKIEAKAYNRGLTVRLWRELCYIDLHGKCAGIAQLVEQLICNQQVVGSNPTAGSLNCRLQIAELPIRDCSYAELTLGSLGLFPFKRARQ